MFERYASRLMISPKTSIGGYIFDVYLSITHTLSATVTSHPTQYGADISDHKFDEPDQLVFQIGMSDASQDLVKGQFYKTGLTTVEEVQVDEQLNNILPKDTLRKKLGKKWEKIKAFLTNSRSVNAFNKLNQLKLLGVPMICVTRLGTYDNMVITNIVADDTNETKDGLRATVTMREVMLTNLQKVQVTSSAQITQTTNAGSKNAFEFASTSYKQALEKAK